PLAAGVRGLPALDARLVRDPRGAGRDRHAAQPAARDEPRAGVGPGLGLRHLRRRQLRPRPRLPRDDALALRLVPDDDLRVRDPRALEGARAALDRHRDGRGYLLLPRALAA